MEVEGLLFKHPAAAEVAIVGFPDARLGERACAFVPLREGARLTLPEVTAYLEAQRMARQQGRNVWKSWWNCRTRQAGRSRNSSCGT